MKRLLQWLDDNLLKLGVSFAIFFVPLYPKLPSIHIVRTWVYIRLEDFLIAALVIVWFLQLLRKRVKLPLPVGIPLVVYWVSGLLTLIYSLLFVGPHLVNFFPHVAALEYFRRIEYMVLFFVAYTTVRNAKDIKNYFITLSIALVGILLYGFGQKYYLNIWAAFPQFFSAHPFCFPSFQTGNEEFAKGLPLCLPTDARITSTFGGHYDLAAFLVIILPIIGAILVTAKKWWVRITTGVLFVLSLILLNFTASRVSFMAYLLGAIATLVFLKKKLWIAPVVILSVAVLLIFNGSTAKRFLETFRFVNVVTNSQGQIVGVAENTLPQNLKDKIAKDQSVIVNAPPPTQNLPTGSSFITLPSAPVATSVAVVKNQIPSTEALRLKLAYGGLEVSTVSGTFLIKKALVYDISFTTRFQAEWPNAWAAFMSNPPLGKGYSTITLASDNDYLRLLGESGFLGFTTFVGIFFIFGIYLKDTFKKVDPFVGAFALGLAGGVIGLFANASLIDVFEASKVAEPLWLLLGIGIGGLSLSGTVSVAYAERLKKILTSHIFLVLYGTILTFIVFGRGLTNFFVGDDFVWLKWAATMLPSDLTHNFVNAGGFFYRPLDKTLVFFLYNFFAFVPLGYHLVTLVLHLLMVVGVYVLGLFIFKKKMWAFILSMIFLVTPLSSEVLFWFATISISLSSVCMLYGLLAYLLWRVKRHVIFYPVSLILIALGLLSYEMTVIFPLLLIAADIFFLKKAWNLKKIVAYLPYLFLDGIYLYLRAHSHVAPVGGDYSYNLAHLIPNSIGNFIGYIGLFVSGTATFAWYTPLRENLKIFAVPVGAVGLLLSAGAVWILWKKFNTLGTETTQQVLFAVLWVVIALAPFLGLGNITERYGYFASIGMSIVIVIILRALFEKIQTKKLAQGVVWSIVVVFVGMNMLFISSEETDWHTAGETTQLALGVFHYEYPDLQKGSHIYFVNVPIKYHNAWVFPVGLPESLWFVYRDDTLKVTQVDTVEKAKALENPLEKNYVFAFSKDGELKEVK